jgi:FkbM family methyltransferase
VRHLHRVGHVEARLPNGHALRLWSRGDDWVSNQVFWRGWAGYEPETARLFFRLAEGARITLDVGAFVGYYSLLAAHANPEGRVFAFEPLPGPRQRLLHHLALNRLTRVECVAAAAGADDGDAQLFHVPEELPTSSSLSREFMAGARELNHLRVPVRALDRFLAEAGLEGVDLVKIDTESTELDVLRGLVRTLEYERPFVLCEVLQGRSNPRGLSDLLRPHSYRYYLLTGQGPIPKAVIEGDPVWLNYLFVPPGRELPR